MLDEQASGSMNSVKKKPVQLLLLFVMLLFTPATFILMGLHLGFFNDVTVTEEQGLQVKAVLIKHQGDYARGGKYIPQVGDYLKVNYQVDCKPISVYMNDTAKVIKKMLESYHGCLVNPEIPVKSNQKVTVKTFSWNEVHFKAHIKAHPSIAIIKASSELKKVIKEQNKDLVYPIISILEPGANFTYFAKATKVSQ